MGKMSQHGGIDLLSDEENKKRIDGMISGKRKKNLAVQALAQSMSLAGMFATGPYGYDTTVASEYRSTPKQRSDAKNGRRTVGAKEANHKKTKRKMAKKSRLKNRK